MKKFYNTVHHTLNTDTQNYYFYLDEKTIKTPKGHFLMTQSLAKADAVVAEWQTQTDAINPSTMPITKYLNSVQDTIIPNHSDVIKQLLDYADNDCIFYFTDKTDTDLHTNQTEYWLPIIRHFENAYSVKLNYGSDLIHDNQCDTFKNHLEIFLKSLSFEDLAGIYTIITSLGSVLLGIYAYKQHIDYDTALVYSRLEEDYNMKNWGFDTDADKNRELINRDFQQAIVFLGL